MVREYFLFHIFSFPPFKISAKICGKMFDFPKEITIFALWMYTYAKA